MIKLVAMLKRKPGTTHEEFLDHWLNRHAPLIAGTPEIARHIVRYEQLPVTSAADWMASAGVDGVTVQWMTGPEAFEAFISEPKYAELIEPDEARFLDRDSLVWMISDEPIVAIDGPAT
jgi:hypothetical protein